MTSNAAVRYLSTHEWVRLEGNQATVGISDHAQEELGDIVFLDMPAVGKTVQKGQSFGVIESVKAASDLYAPLSGTVAEVNQALANQPALVNSDPFGEGWIIRLTVSNPAEWDALLDEGAYRASLGNN